MARQRDAARKAWSGSGEAATEQLWFEIREKHGATEFLGYGTESAEGQVVALVKDGKLVDAVEAGDAVMLIANQTPFYAESGGQMGDARSEEHTSELQSLMRNSYAVFCLTNKKNK